MEEWEREFDPVDEPEEFGEAELDEDLSEHRLTSPADDAVVAEIQQRAQAKANWLTSLLTLIFSGILFYAAGGAAWDWKFALLLVPILLFHELGHLVAMWVFGYRNLRMFFIPLFGAAVTGQNYNVASWKKSVVSLMGPVPGIAVGVALGIAGLVMNQKLLLEIGAVTVLLNGLNLLPILPLDGGWNLNALLFSRYVPLEAAFRLIASVVLIAGALYLRLTFLTGIGILFLISIPAAYRVASIAAQLRKEGWASRTGNSELIPDATAHRIVEELRGRFAKSLKDKHLANLALQVYENLNARPAGWFATISLTGVHLAALVVALIAGPVFLIGKFANLGDFVREAADRPTLSVKCGTTQNWRGAEAIAPERPHFTLVGTLPSRAQAEQVFNDLKSSLPPTASATLFGQSVIATLPEIPELHAAWGEKFQVLCPEVRGGDDKNAIQWTMVCIAPSEEAAKVIEDDLLESQFNAPPLKLIPPWSTSAVATPAQRMSRATWRSLVSAKERALRDLPLDPGARLIVGKDDKVTADDIKRVQERWQTANRKSVEQALSDIRLKDPATIDVEMTNLFEKFHKEGVAEKTSQELLHEIAKRMGTLPMAGVKPEPGADRENVRSVYVVRTGLLLRFSFLTFHRVEDGLPAFFDWLCSKRCIDFKYRVEKQVDGADDDADMEEEE